MFTPDILARLTSQAILFLEAPLAVERYTPTHMEVSVHAADMILLSAGYDAGIITQSIGMVSLATTIPRDQGSR